MEDNKARKVTYEEFKDEAKYIEGYIVASLTDEYIVDRWPVMQKNSLEDKKTKILEIRIFNENEELKLVRTDISKEFVMRHKVDKNLDKDSYMDESQYLDIDTKKTGALLENGGYVYATGGGKYYLPRNDIEGLKIKIRYYFDSYENSGQARIGDWRILGFEND
jgi:hypothetical protein